MKWGSFDSFRENLQLEFWTFDDRWKRLATNGRKRLGVNAILGQLRTLRAICAQTPRRIKLDPKDFR